MQRRQCIVLQIPPCLPASYCNTVIYGCFPFLSWYFLSLSLAARYLLILARMRGEIKPIPTTQKARSFFTFSPKLFPVFLDEQPCRNDLLVSLLHPQHWVCLGQLRPCGLNSPRHPCSSSHRGEVSQRLSLLGGNTKPNQIINARHPCSSFRRGEVSQRSSLLGGNTKPNQTKNQCSLSQLFFSPRRGKSEVAIACKIYQTKPNQINAHHPALLLTEEK